MVFCLQRGLWLLLVASLWEGVGRRLGVVSRLVEVTLHHYFVARGVFSDKLAGYL